MTRSGRRAFLAALGCGALSLPFLESLAPRSAAADSVSLGPFVIFLRQANGVAAAQETAELGVEPERFWPRQHGALTPENVEGRAIGALVEHLDRLLVVGNVNLSDFAYADAHAWGALQGLTARGPVVPGTGNTAEASGESLDHRVGRELNPGGRDSLFLYAGSPGGHLGGPCVSYRGSGTRRAAIHDPRLAYQLMMGLSDAQAEEVLARERSANDSVRARIAALRGRPELSADDRRRLDQHADAIRDVERALSCGFAEDQVAALDGLAPGYASGDGDEVLAAVEAHARVAALAVACGYTRAVAIQVGAGTDTTRYHDLDTGAPLESFHFISHRRLSDAPSGGPAIPGSDAMHHMVDVQFARAFKVLLDQLAAYELPNNERLIDRGVSVWYNDLANGPGHSGASVPYVLAGSAGGFLKQGQYVEVEPGKLRTNHPRMLNTIGSAAGLRTADGALLDDFGDGDRRAPFEELLAGS